MRELFIPFGRRVENSQRTRSESRVLVGRDGLRAYLIDHLNIAGPRTSILVTGRRGTGKTAYVDHCLREHNEAVVERFLISQQGRPFIGVALLLLLALLVPIALVFATGFLEILVPLAEGNMGLLLLILPLFLICATPGLYAPVVLRHLTKATLGKQAQGSLWAGIFAIGILIFLVFLSPVLKAPAVFVGTGIFGIACLTIIKLCWGHQQIVKNEIAALFCATGFCLFLFILLPYAYSYMGLKNAVLITELILAIFVIHRAVNGGWFKSDNNLRWSNIAKALLLVILLALVGYFFNSLLFDYSFLIGAEHRESTSMLFPTVTVSFCALLGVGVIWAIKKIKKKWKPTNKTKALIKSHPPAKAINASLILTKAILTLGIAYQLTYPLNPAHLMGHKSTETVCEFEENYRYLNLTPVGCTELIVNFNSSWDYKTQLIKAPEEKSIENALSWPNNVLNSKSDELQRPKNYVASPHITHYGHLVPGSVLGYTFKSDTKINKEILPTIRLFPTLFSKPLEDTFFIIFLFSFIVIAYFFEFEWIIRPNIPLAKTRVVSPFRDRNDTNSNSEIFQVEENQRQLIAKARHWQRATSVYPILQNWVPSLVVRVNLGFERLNHESVTQSMLKGLSDAYRKQFLARSSVYFAVSTFVSLFLLLITLDITSRKFFELPKVPSYQNTIYSENDKPCEILRRMSSNLSSSATMQDFTGSQSLLAGCKALPGLSNRLLPALYTPLISIPVTENNFPSLTVFAVLNQNTTPPPQFFGVKANSENSTPRDDLTFRLYHMILLVLLVLLVKTFFGSISPFQPYRDVYNRIQRAYQAMTTERVERKRSLMPFGRNFALITGAEREKTFSEGRRDPRSVELTLMTILEDIHSPKFPVPFGGRLARVVPWPEVTFIFDELDKVTGLMGPELSNTNITEDERRMLDAERKRAYALRELLSDMKRIISSAPARFIFVGNRLLHDEIVADRTRREAHLSSIFEREIYLPSLLTDHRGIDLGKFPRRKRWDARIEEYLIRVFTASRSSHKRHQENRKRPFFALKSNRPVGAEFDLAEVETPDSSRAAFNKFIIWQRDAGSNSQGALTSKEARTPTETTTYILRCITGYLSFRSAGNPKKLEQLMRELLRLTDRAVNRQFFYGPEPSSSEPQTLSDTINDVDLIHLTQNDLYRIELVNHLYRHVASAYDETAVGRDDKAAVAILYLFEFLLKFHARAFSWSSLERVDELAHVHRSPDLRKWLSSLVDISSERFMHRVLNGLYMYRFQGDIAAELKYASRLNEVDQEAFNFTLDESQNLKASYQLALKQSKVSNEDIIFGLGELHEYDKEYEAARHHYRHCIRLVDETLFYHVGRESVDRSSIEAFLSTLETIESPHSTSVNTGLVRLNELKSPTLSQLMNIGSATDILSSYLPWVRKRVRLMLHAAMTEELTRNLSAALIQYHNSNRLALQSIRSLVLSQDRYLIHATKNLNVLFQPMFAAAWAAEKLPGGIDTGTPVIEHGLRVLRDSKEGLPFYRNMNLTHNQSTVLNEMISLSEDNSSESLSGQHSNFALIASELHNKAGDLYFLKGRGLPSISLINDLAVSGAPKSAKDRPGVQFRKAGSGYEGHSFKAHYHYGIGSHQLRRFLFYRRTSSRFTLNHLNSWRSLGDDIISRGQSVVYKRFSEDPSLEWSPENDSNIFPTLRTVPSANWPKYVREGIFNNLTDLADCFIARTSLVQCIAELRNIDKSKSFYKTRLEFPLFKFVTDAKQSVPEKVEVFCETVENWFEFSDEETLFDASKKNSICEIVKHCLGAWRSSLKEHEKSPSHIDDIILFEHVNRSLDRVLAGVLFGIAGARALEKTAMPQSAAREYLRISGVIRAVLEKLSILYHLGPTKDVRVEQSDRGHNDFYSTLQALAEYALHRFQVLSIQGQSANSKGVSSVKLAITTWASIRLVSDRLASRVLPNLSENLNPNLLSNLLKSLDLGKLKDEPEELLKELENRHPFPAFNRLQSMQSRFLHNIFTDQKLGSNKNDLDAWLELHEDYDANVYNSPGVVGTVLALWSLKLRPGKEENCSLAPVADRYLSHAEALISGEIANNAYSDRHYLYDDFNDRQLHSAAAVQMMSADLIVLLREALLLRPTLV